MSHMLSVFRLPRKKKLKAHSTKKDILLLRQLMTRIRSCRWSARIARGDVAAFRKAQEAALDIVPQWEKYIAGRGATTWGTGTTTTTLSPDERLESLLEALNKLDGLGYKRSAQQKLFHKAFIVASLKHIYGREIHRHVGYLMRKFDISELRPDVIVCAIRRAGKTFAVALFVAAFILTQPGVEINVYSTAKRASRKMQALIWKIVVTLSGTPAVVQVYNQEELVVTCGNTTSKVNSLPSSVEISFACFCCVSPSPLSVRVSGGGVTSGCGKFQSSQGAGAWA